MSNSATLGEAQEPHKTISDFSQAGGSDDDVTVNGSAKQDTPDLEVNLQNKESVSEKEAFDRVSNAATTSFNEIKLEEGETVPMAATMEIDLDMDGAGRNEQSSLDGDYHKDLSEDQRRVKVYELIDNKWTDRGTAFCQSAYDQDKQMAKLIARSEDNPDEAILQFYIRGEDVYQRQQETLIVWTELDGTDYALSFQDVAGCADVWEFILEVQQAINSDRDRGDENDEPLSSSSPPHGPGRPITFASIVNASHLPPPQFGIMLEVERAIKHVGRNIHHRDKLCEHIIQTDYIRLMIDVHNQAEDLEQLDDLHALCSCMQSILLLNDHTIFEHVTAEDIFLGVCGILEYDPDFPNHKACYRDILRQHAHFKQPIPFGEDARRKIQQTYRLQFLKDVVLNRVMEDSTFNVLSSCIIFNQIDLINQLQTDENFLREIVNLFTSEATGKEAGEKDEENSSLSDSEMNLEKRRKEVVLLIQQLCVMGKNVQLQTRLLLFRALVDRGIMHAIQWGLSQADPVIISSSAEVFGVLLEHDTNGIRQHIMRQADADAELSLIHVVSVTLAGNGDLALKNQLADCLKTLLETQPPEGPETAISGMRAIIRQREDPVTEKFLEYIYSKGSIKALFRGLLDIPEYKSMSGTSLFLTPDKATLYFYLSELLCCAIQQHGFRSSHFLLDSTLSTRIASLLTSREKHLRLAAVRVFRACLKLNNHNIVKHLIKHDVLLPIIDLTTREASRDNLLSSSCQEFFEHMRKENTKDLIDHIITKYEAKIRGLAERPVVGPRFQNFIRRWEQNIEPPPTDNSNQPDASNSRRWGHGNGLEAEEEDWFNGSDDDEIPSPPPPWIQQHLASHTHAKRKRPWRGTTQLEWPNRRRQPPSPTPANSPPSSPQASGLVDYEGDDDDSPTAVPSTDPQQLRGDASGAEDVTESPAKDSSSQSSSTQTLSESLRVKAPQPIKLPTLGSSTPDILGVAAASTTLPAAQRTNGVSIVSSELPRRTDKRRREEDEDDEMMVRLSSKGKRVNAVSVLDEVKKPLTAKQPPKDESKKIKLKLGPIGIGVSLQKADNLTHGAKDGDNG